jgi:hypothetical protein
MVIKNPEHTRTCVIPVKLGHTFFSQDLTVHLHGLQNGLLKADANRICTEFSASYSVKILSYEVTD